MKSEILWETNKAGIVHRAHIHDGLIIGISSLENNMSLEIRRTDKSLVTVELANVSGRSLAVWGIPIISEIYAWKVGDAPNVNYASDVGWNSLLGESYKDEDLAATANKIIRENPDLYLVQASCSYGGNISVLCKEVRLFEAH